MLPSSTAPVIRVVSVDGIAVPAQPRGSLAPVDVTINTAAEVVIALEGQRIPSGAVVDITVVNETEGLQMVLGVALEGTLERSTATTSLMIPAGFSRIYTRARW